jgi:RelA/SpoT family (p)ppGpp synthetase
MNLSSVDEEFLRHAFNFAYQAYGLVGHETEKSYEVVKKVFDHSMKVARVLATDIPFDDKTVASALLHELVENSTFQIKDIRAEFGDSVADIVDGAMRISNILETRDIVGAENHRKMLLSMINDIRVMMLKFADCVENMRLISALPENRREKLAKAALDIYSPLAHRFGLSKIQENLGNQAFNYLYPQQHQYILHETKITRKERGTYIKRFLQPIEESLKTTGLQFNIEARVKQPYSIYNKLMKQNTPIDKINDLFAVRIILDTPNSNDCFTVEGIISSIYDINSKTSKNYISSPKANGYQSLHVTVKNWDNKMVEVQIRTRSMHEIAEKGIAAHWKYKENLMNLDKNSENWMSWIRELVERANERSLLNPSADSYRVQIFQDEIYLFTPKGELKILPLGATPIDFAYAVHSDVGFHCLSAKVNGRIVPLDSHLHSGDQVEIITSKNQTPNTGWEQFVVTHKAKSHIRKWIKDEERKSLNIGREIWEKRTKKLKLHLNDDDLLKYLHDYKVSDLNGFYLKLQREEINPDTLIHEIELRLKHPQPESTNDQKGEGIFNRFLTTARNITGGITLFGTKENFMHSYAKCCNPIPGDEIMGYVTKGEGIKIHLKSCHNFVLMAASDPQRVVEVAWPSTEGGEYVAAIYITGEDRPGLLNDITHSISTYQSTNIRAVKIDVRDSVFEGTIMLNVKDKTHLERITERLNKVKGVSKAKRMGD